MVKNVSMISKFLLMRWRSPHSEGTQVRVIVVYASGMHKCSSVRLQRNSVEEMVNFSQSILLAQPIERMLEKIQDLGNAAEILHKHPLFVVRTVWESR